MTLPSPITRTARPVLALAAAAGIHLSVLAAVAAGQTVPAPPAAPASPQGAAAAAPAPGPRTYQVSPVEEPVKVDAVLDEPVWATAQAMEAPYKFFPADGSPSPVRTDCRVTFDDANLYLGCVAEDPEPSRIRARYADRDAAREDDHIFLVLDPFNDRRRAFEFGISALGVQMDATFSEVDGVEDFTWDAIWKSAGRITPEGYVVEAAIPFSSLRFPHTSDVQTWGVLVARNYPREARYALRSIHIDRNQACLLCQADKLEGFRGVQPGRDLEVTPTITTRRSDVRTSFPAGRLDSGDVDPEFGVSGRWGITPNINLNATVNPDFSQVEADVAQLEVNERFALSYPEKRPFFLEGADFFQTPTRLVFTRSIVDPVGGLKLTGKEGKNVFGVFAASDRVSTLLFPTNAGTGVGQLREEVHTGVARYRRDIGRSSTIGATYTGRMGEGYFNHVASVDGFLRLSPAKFVRMQYSFAGTEYPDTVVRAFRQKEGTLTDGVLSAEFVHRSREWTFSTLLRDVGEDFRADAGFIPRADFRGATVNLERVVWGGPQTWYNRLGFLTFAEWLGNHAGKETDLGLAFVTFYQGPRQSAGNVGLGFNRKLFAGRTFEMFDVRSAFEIRPTARTAFSLGARIGEDIDVANARKANIFQVVPGVELRVGRSLYLELDHAIRRLSTQDSEPRPDAQILDAQLTEARAVYHFGVRTFVRAILQYQTLEQDPTLFVNPVRPETNTLFSQLMFAHKVNPQTVLFVGYTDNQLGLHDVDLTRTGRTFFVKLGYALRL
ncbi:MAG TPA: DUF5916 domain-containing protein [Longimicrobiaceae bacterium]|nr:DUF5916 domain-containing protein [Longimicrobiaceae bacterium]